MTRFRSALLRPTKARGAEAARLTFPATTDGYRALHKHLFQDLYDWAGQDRTDNIAKGGSSFAAVPYVARELDKRFADIGHRSEEHTSELQSLMRTSYAIFCLNKNHTNIELVTSDRCPPPHLTMSEACRAYSVNPG